MVHVTYMSSDKKEQSVVAEVDGAQVLVNLPFITKLSDLLMNSLKPLTSGIPERESPPSEASKDMGSELRPKMTVSLSVTRPCIALVEKPGIPNPKTLVLEVCAKYMQCIACVEIFVCSGCMKY